MAKILKIDHETVIVGMDDGSTIEANKSDFSFEIVEMMSMEAYKHDDKYIFTIAQGQSEQSQTLQEEEPIPGKKYVNKTPYALLYFFLGGFGAHEFYAGNVKKALSWLIITIILYIIQIIPTIYIYSHYGPDYILRYINSHGHIPGNSYIFVILGWAYFLLIRVLSIVVMTKKANANGKIPVSTW